jgi:glycerol-3-phosphate dehydrogenase (NAD(P)+)
MIDQIGIIGAGAWGTALAQVAVRAGRKALMWAREPEVAQSIRTSGVNPMFLPDVALDPTIQVTTDFDAFADVDALLIVTPAQFVRSTIHKLLDVSRPDVPLILCAKGIEQGTGLLLTEVVGELAPERPLAVLSGPTFASEVARGLPTAITLACADEALGLALSLALGHSSFRPYWSPDLIGAEVGGAVKNVLAIACGIVEGRALGHNARAALITRGQAEMLRYALARGAKAETLNGLCGLGDLILTCSSTTSRNMSLGAALGQGRALANILAERRSIAEGYHTAPILIETARNLGVAMPICAAVNAILYQNASVDDAIEGLLSRPFRPEGD